MHTFCFSLHIIPYASYNKAENVSARDYQGGILSFRPPPVRDSGMTMRTQTLSVTDRMWSKAIQWLYHLRNGNSLCS